ncbi:MAG: hypothetical protein V4558_05710 [Gemmatimonadota bacterium]
MTRALLLSLLLASPLSAQSPPRPLEFPRDSAVFAALRQAVLPVLRREMEWIDNGTLRRPLRFRAPAQSDSFAWQWFARELSDSLFARPVVALDRIGGVLSIGRAQLHDSLLEVSLSIGAEYFCGTSRGGNPNDYSLRAVRRSDGSWPPFRLNQESVFDGGCFVKSLKPEKMPGAAARIAWITERYPCPPKVPREWTAADASLGMGFRCSLLVLATATLEEAPATPRLPKFDPGATRCVRLSSHAMLGFGDSKELEPGDWGVTFYGRNQPGVSVWIDAVSGETRGFPVRPSMDPKSKPPCSSGGGDRP